MKKFSLFFLVPFLLLFTLSACSAQSADTVVESTMPTVDRLIAEGRLMPVNTMEQSFLLPGQIVEVLVQDGEMVQKDQLLARLSDSPEARLNLARAQQEVLAAQQALELLRESADLNLAQSTVAVITAQNQLDLALDVLEEEVTEENEALVDLAREQLAQADKTQTKLEAGDGVDADLLAAAEARLATAEAAEISARASLELLDLKASMAGMVVDLSLQQGQTIAAGQPVITIADFSDWVVKTQNLTEIELVDVEIGQQVEIILDALPDKIFRGEVIHINARYAEVRGDITYTATLVLSDVDPRMRWGMTAAVQFLP